MALVYGSTGEDVKALQKQLNSLGYNLDVDGSFGPATQDAVKKYQAKNGLAVDGSVGPQTSASLSANANKTPTTTNTGGAKTLNAKLYEGISASISAATPETDKYGNTIRRASKEAIDAANKFWDQQVAETQGFLNRYPGVTQPFKEGEFDSLYGNVMTTAPNGKQVAIKDLVEVGVGTYTYDESKKNAAIDQGYTVTETTYNGKPAWHIEGIQRPDKPGTANADKDLLGDKGNAALEYETQQYALYGKLAEEALAAGNQELANEYFASQEQAHANAERLRANTWLGGYVGGSDGSMYMPIELFTNKGSSDMAGNVQGGSSFDRTQSGSSSGGSSSGGSSSGGSSSGGSSSGNLTSGDHGVNSYEQYIKEMYAAQKAAALAAIDAAYKQNVNAIDRAGAGLDEAYQAARNQTAGASELAKRNFAQYAAANGLNSGTGGQADLAHNVALQNNLNAINMQEAQSVADLELQKANAKVEYNSAIAQAEAEGNFELANALYEEKVRYENAMNAAIQQEFQNNLALMQYNNSVKQQAWQNAFAEKQYNDGLTQQNWENLFRQNQYQDSLTQNGQSALADYGAAFLNAGVMPSAEMLAAMNMSEADAQRFVAALQSKGTGDTPVGAEPTLTFSQVMSAIENGIVTPAVKEAFEYYNGISYDEFNGTPDTPVVTGDAAGLWNIMKGNIGNSALGQLVDGQGSNMVVVDGTLSQMRNAGANATQLLDAIQSARDTGVITSYAYDYLKKKYVTGNG